MDLTSIDPKFTCTTDITILDFTKSIQTLDIYAQNKGKYFVINYYKSVFKWLADVNLIYDIESMSLNHDANRSLSYDRLFPQLKNKKYILNSYEEFRPILIMYNDYIWDNIENYATTNNLYEITCEVNISGPNSPIDIFNNAAIFEFRPAAGSIMPLVRNVKNIVKYNFGSDKPFTLINLIYSILYSNTDLTVQNTISNNNILLFALILDTYISLSDKVENDEGEKIIEDVAKPIILHRNYDNVERHMGNSNLGFYKENPVPNLFWTDDSHNLLINDTIHTIEALRRGRFATTSGPDNYDHRYYDYYVTNLNFMETIRYGYYSNLYYSIMFPIFIPTPIDIETGMPAAHGPNVSEMTYAYPYQYADFNGSIKGFDMFFILRLSSGAMDDQIPAVSDIKNVITYLGNNMKVGNAFNISILACFNDHEMEDVRTVMLLCRGIYAMPVEIEYLGTNGTQYVDVGLKGNGSTDAFEIEFQQTTHNVQVRFVSDGTAAGAVSSNPCQMYINGSNGLSYNPGSTAKWYEISSTYRSTGTGKYKWSVDYKNQIIKINNGQWTCNKENSNTTQNIMIFAKSGSNQRFKGKFFGFKMWKNGTLVRDMIPVRVGHTGCMLDKIENKLYNTKAGSFTLGPDKNRLVNSNVYIETSGTEPQYIMTDCFPSGSNISFYIKFKIISYGDSLAYTKIMSAYYADSVQAFRVIKNNTNNLSLIVTCGGRPNANGNVSIPIALNTNYALFCDSNAGIAVLREYGNYVTNVVADTTYVLPAPATPISISNLMIGDITNKVKFRLYGLKIWDNETCIGDFMPHGLNNGEEFTSEMEGVLYDSINDKILRNLGSGKIVNGSEFRQAAPSSSEYSYYYQQFIEPAKYIYVDDFGGTTTREANEEWVQDIGYNSMEDFLSEYLDLPDNDDYGAEKYKYTGTSITWNNDSYYLWEMVDEFDNFIGEDERKSEVAYIITDTLAYAQLNSKSIEYYHSNRQCPYVARLTADMNTYATANSEDYIIRVENDDYTNQFFTLSILTSGNLVFNSLEFNDIYEDSTGYDLYYSKNGGAWHKFTNYNNDLSISVNAGDKIYFYGYDHAPKAFSIYKSNTTCTYNAEGNIMSLIYGKSFKGKTEILYDYQFANLFGNNYSSGVSSTFDTHLINAENLILPATTLKKYCYFQMFAGCTGLITPPKLPASTLSESCYLAMFEECTSLVTPPELPASTLAVGCYSYMFKGCTSLTSIPELQVITLVDRCYQHMFNGCTSLTTVSILPAYNLAYGCYNGMFTNCTSLTQAPVLPAIGLAEFCYSYMFSGCSSLQIAPDLPAQTLRSKCYECMFQGCSNLTYIKAMFVTPPGTAYTDNWVNGVASSGTFVKNSNATWSNSFTVSTIPIGWGYITADHDQSIEYIDYSKEYFTLVALEAGKIILEHVNSTMGRGITHYKVDNGSWIEIPAYPTQTYEISVGRGTKVYMKGHGGTYNWSAQHEGDQINSTCRFNVQGNLQSLGYGDSFITGPFDHGKCTYDYLFDGADKLVDASNLYMGDEQTVTNGESYAYMFNYCTSLVYPPKFIYLNLYNGAANCHSMFSHCTSLLIPPILSDVDEIDHMCCGDMFNGCTSLRYAPKLSATSLRGAPYYGMFAGCTSLKTPPELPFTELWEGSCGRMFYGCTSLETAPELLPLEMKPDCYADMFSGCTSLRRPPELPATTLAAACYRGMFYGCTNLETCPALSATTLKVACYDRMFYECTSITRAPDLPALTLVEESSNGFYKGSYNKMFYGCTNLRRIKAMFTSTPGQTTTGDWVRGVASSGIFVKNSAASWNVTGYNGVPTGWTVTTASS